MDDRSLTSRLIDAGIVACLLVTLGALIYGHFDVGGTGLSLADSYITEYMKRAPHWPWLIVSAFAFALLLFLLALVFARKSGGNVVVLVGSLLLAATAMANFFVAYAPVRRVEQPPPPAHEWWTPTWWFTSQTSRTDYEHGMADGYSDVHYRAIRLVVSFGIAAMFTISLAGWSVESWRSFSRWSFAAAAMMSALFLMGDHWDFRRGVWQRLGFVLMYAWLWSAWAACRTVRKPSAAENKQR
jgi:ABC-type Fe3+-siderophore transport system permease subunit